MQQAQTRFSFLENTLNRSGTFTLLICCSVLVTKAALQLLHEIQCRQIPELQCSNNYFMSSKHHRQCLFKPNVRGAPSNKPCFTEALLEWQGAPSNPCPSSPPRENKRTFVHHTRTQERRGSMTALHARRNPLLVIPSKNKMLSSLHSKELTIKRLCTFSL